MCAASEPRPIVRAVDVEGLVLRAALVVQLGGARVGEVDLDAFKIVYVAPMKALVQEVVRNFGKRLAPYGVQVRELSGDQSLPVAQLQAPQVIVTTDITASVPYQKADPDAGMAMVRSRRIRATKPIALEAVASTPATIEEVPE